MSTPMDKTRALQFFEVRSDENQCRLMTGAPHTTDGARAILTE
jgi:hypothetical protein